MIFSLKYSALLVGGALSVMAATPAPLKHHVVQEIDAPVVGLPDETRLPFGWVAIPVTHATPSRLEWVDISAPPAATTARLRVTIAVDDRTQRYIEVRLGHSGRIVGGFDARYPQALQMFELELPRELALSILREGITLRLREEGRPIWILAPSTTKAGVRSTTQVSAAPCPAEFQPHLLFVPAIFNARAEFEQRLASVASVAPFGWNEGCVLDGLRALAHGDTNSPFEAARRQHWALFTDDCGRLDYENPRAGTVFDAFDGIESLLPVADMTLHDPNHPVVAAGRTFLGKISRIEGVLQGGPTLTAEGSYTMGYPLAVLAAIRQDRAQAEDATRQFLGRRDRLWFEDAFWLRHQNSGRRTYRNWARGITWHFLGMVRALPFLRQTGIDTGEVETEIRRVAQLVRRHQRPDGLWNCFIDEAQGTPDTSGSAGLAAALALGARLNVLGAEDLAAARKAIPALEGKLTPDGFLGGVAQGNRGGEELQRSDYRVLSNMGAGLLAQAIAATQ